MLLSIQVLIIFECDLCVCVCVCVCVCASVLLGVLKEGYGEKEARARE